MSHQISAASLRVNFLSILMKYLLAICIERARTVSIVSSTITVFSVYVAPAVT